jgi:formate dehydrogenase assembly factor FdhD
MKANMIFRDKEKQINEVHSSGMNRDQRRKNLRKNVVCGICGKKIMFKNAYTRDKGLSIFCYECSLKLKK